MSCKCYWAGEKDMIEKLLKDWKGEISINDVSVEASKIDFKTLSESTHIILHSNSQKRIQTKIDSVDDVLKYQITVKRYMTQTATPEFDFMAKWNKNVPMPLRTMVGTIEKETRGMIYMKLHGQAEPVIRCMRCGRLLTNPISQYYGIGPECMSKLGFECEIDDVDTITKKLVDVVWEGWIIKSAITERKEVA
ncbi:hypothetical protein J6O48_08260 [bacterium]|nr:hypothetical protein [bacterium]